jgi:hypothetical protein
MIISATGARSPDPESARQWMEEQRVFISSAMSDTAAARDVGAQPVWFEELGRDSDAVEAYVSGVDSSTIYVGILNQQYGRMSPTGFSATETEYERARERGSRIIVYTADDASDREGHLVRFIERIRTFVTTENYVDIADLDRRFRRRLSELAAEALSPWIKLGDYVFRSELLIDSGDSVSPHLWLSRS